MRFKRLAFLPVLVLVYALVAEAGLQVAAFFMQRSTRAEMPVAWVTGNLRVLCLGDSNTYGVWIERHEAYPQQLEAVWNERIESPKIEVLNLGVPGTNSSRVVSVLPSLLEKFAPDIVIIMVGVNDFWTLPVPLDDAQSAKAQPGFLKRHSLLYKLFYLFQRGRMASSPEFLRDAESSIERRGEHKLRVGDLELDMGFAAALPGYEGDPGGLARNLLRLVELARDAGSSLYLMTYPSQRDYYAFANHAIGNFARATGAPLIDLNAVFAPRCPQNTCPEILLPDGHPKAPGYRIVAETILERLQRAGSS